MVAYCQNKRDFYLGELNRQLAFFGRLQPHAKSAKIASK